MTPEALWFLTGLSVGAVGTVSISIIVGLLTGVVKVIPAREVNDA